MTSCKATLLHAGRIFIWFWIFNVTSSKHKTSHVHRHIIVRTHIYFLSKTRKFLDIAINVLKYIDHGYNFSTTFILHYYIIRVEKKSFLKHRVSVNTTFVLVQGMMNKRLEEELRLFSRIRMQEHGYD